LDRRADIGYELDSHCLFSATYHPATGPVGISYYRGGYGGQREPYDPQRALARCMQHAHHFVQECKSQVESLYSTLGRKPVLVAMFDSEHFGHWWAEGPMWLDLVAKKLACEQDVIRLVTAEEYLKLNPTNQVVNPSMSSWGYQGYSEVWLMGRNHWIYPALYKALESYKRVITSMPAPGGLCRLALNQYLRELLLAQSSDWAYIMHAETAQSYAENRVREHLNNMRKIELQIRQNSIDSQWINDLANKNNIFAEMDLLEIYNGALQHSAQTDTTSC
jgi:1,4-alpha-glucan branching enzyme